MDIKNDNIKQFFSWRRAGIVLAVFFLIAAAFYGFPDSPAPWFDEGINLGVAKSFAERGVFNLETGPGEYVSEKSLLITTNYPLLFFISLSFKIFGVGLWPARMVMILFLFIFAWIFYKLADRYYGPNMAALGLILLVTFLPFYGNGKSALGEIPGLTYFFAGILLFSSVKTWRIFLSGLFFGLAMATKPLFLLLGVGLAVGEIFFAVKNKKLEIKRWLVLAGGIIIPISLWIYTLLPPDASLAYLQKSFSYYNNPYNTEGQMAANLNKLFTESTPLHFLSLLAVFILSKILVRPAFWKKGEIIMFIFMILNIIFYLRTVGWYRYFFPAHVLAIFLFPGAFFSLADKLLIKLKFRKQIFYATLFILVAIQIAVFKMNIGGAYYKDPLPRLSAEKINTLIEPRKSVLVIEFPELFFMLKGDRLYQYLRANPHVVFGRDLLSGDNPPDYIVSSDWRGNFYLKNYDTLLKDYSVILKNARYNLYARH